MNISMLDAEATLENLHRNVTSIADSDHVRRADITALLLRWHLMNIEMNIEMKLYKFPKLLSQ
jgi:hypothetical protein